MIIANTFTVIKIAATKSKTYQNYVVYHRCEINLSLNNAVSVEKRQSEQEDGG